VNPFSREKIEEMKAAGRIDEETAEQMMKTMPSEGPTRGPRGPRGRAAGKGRAVAVAVASGPGAKAEAHSTGSVVVAEAGPGESVYSHDDFKKD